MNLTSRHLLLAAATLVAASSAHAADGTWNVDANGTWSTTSNWTGGTVADGSGSTAFFTNDISADRTVTLGAPQTLGNIVFDDAGATGDSAWVITGSTLTLAGGTPTITTNTNATIASILSGTAGLIKTGAGTLTLSGANNYTGGTFVNGGILIQDLSARSGAIGIGAVTVATGAVYELLSGTNTGFDTTLFQNNTISGAGTIRKTGTGYLGIAHTGSNTNGFTGTYDIQAGILGFNSGVQGSGLATINITGATAKLDVRTGTVKINALNGVAGSEVYISHSAGATLSLGNNNGSGTFNGTLINGSSALTLIKNGTGTQILTGANSYTGSTTINGGTLDLGGGTATGSISASSALVLGGGTLSYTRTGTNTQTFAGTTLNAGASAVTAVAGNTVNLGTSTRNAGGTVNFSSTGDIRTSLGTANTLLTAANGAAYATVGGTDWAAKDGTNTSIVGLSTIGGYTNFTAGTVALTGNADLTGSAGTYSLGANASPTTIRNLVSGNTIDLAGFTLATGGVLSNVNQTISGTGALTAATAGGELVLHQTAGTATVSAVIDNNTSASSLTKSGAGTLVLSGENTYTGKTYLSGGVLNIVADNNLGTAPGAAVADQLTIAGGTLQFGADTTLAANRGITITAANGTVDTNGFNSTVAGIIAGPGGLTKSGAGTLTLTGSNTYTGGTTVNAGTLKLDFTSRGAGAQTFTLGNVVVNSTSTLELYNNTAVAGNNYNTASSLPINTIFTGSGTITKTGVGVVDFFTGTNLGGFTGLIDVQAGLLGDQSGSLTTGTASLNVASGAFFDLRTANVSVNNLTGSGTIASSWNNPATKTLTVGAQGGSSTFAGVIQNEVPAAAGGTAGGSIALRKAGTGTLTLTGANNYSGGTSVDAGVLQIGNGVLNGSIGNGVNSVVSVASGATLRFQQNGTGAPAALPWVNLTGNGTVVFNFAGSGVTNRNVTLGNTSAFTGGVVVESGRVANGAATTFANTSALTVKSGGQLGMWLGGTYGAAINLEGTGYGETGFEVSLRGSNDAATLNLNGLVTLTGNTAVGSRGTGVMNFNNVIGESGGARRLTVGTAAQLNGTVALNAANTYTGGTTVANGTLIIADTGSIKVGAAGVTVNTGAILTVNGTLELTTGSATIANAGTLTLSGTSVLDIGSFFNGQADGSTYELITGTTTGTFGSILFDTGAFSSVTFNNANGMLSFTAVPEPSTYGLIGAGALAAVALVRRRRKAAGAVAA